MFSYAFIPIMVNLPLLLPDVNIEVQLLNFEGNRKIENIRVYSL